MKKGGKRSEKNKNKVYIGLGVIVLLSISWFYLNKSGYPGKDEESIERYSSVENNYTHKGTSSMLEKRKLSDETMKELLEHPEILFLPEFEGRGDVPSLRSAMLRDKKLQKLVEKFRDEKDTDKRRALLEKILPRWTGNERVSRRSRGKNIDGRRLAVLESFMGKPFVGVDGPNPNIAATPLLNEAYKGLFDHTYYTLLIQSQLEVVSFLISTSPRGDEFAGVENYTRSILDKNIVEGRYFYREVIGAAKVFGWDENQSYLKMKKNIQRDYHFSE